MTQLQELTARFVESAFSKETVSLSDGAIIVEKCAKIAKMVLALEPKADTIDVTTVS